MSEQNLVGVPLKDLESFLAIRALIGGIYDTMNRENQPNLNHNHVGNLLDASLAEFVNAPKTNSFFGKPL
jgi:hypothetical protein